MADTNLLVLAKEFSKLRSDVKEVLKMPVGPEGKQGERGLPGKDGKDGLNGRDGIGVQGPPGAPGRDGRDGKDGKDGIDGQDGVSVTNAYIDFDGSLVIELSDGNQIDAGFVSVESRDNIVQQLKNGALSLNELLPSQTGNANKYLKTDGENTSWDTLATVATSGAYADLTGKPTLGSISSQNADSVAITGGAINGTTIGSTTPDAATFTTLIGGKDQDNYGQLTGGATTKAVQFRTLGSDTNISMALQPKGTGAIDLAAGSSGVNISNGGTVTAITRTSAGQSYTAFPSITISAPTTVGGVQATASVTGMNFYGSSPQAINNGGTGYTVGDVLTIASGAVGGPCRLTVTAVSGGGVITAASHTTFGTLTTLPTVPYSVTGGTGTGATFTSTWQAAFLAITNAGSGYVEQPTVTFSGGGGSGAAAYATVGSGTTIQFLGATQSFKLPQGEVLRLAQSGTNGTGYWQITGAAAAPSMQASSGNAVFGTTAATPIQFITNGATEQLRVAHTASAVNYVQVTGAATGSGPTISSQGSDTNAALTLTSKGSGDLRLSGGSSGWIDFRAGGVRSAQVEYVASAVNYLNLRPAVAGSSPVLASTGSDTNIDLALTPKGTGLVCFGTYTAGAPTATGYISIKAADGTTYKVLVGT